MFRIRLLSPCPTDNLKFAVTAWELVDLHRSLMGFDLAGILCLKDERTPQSDRCLSYKKRWLQLEKVQPLVLAKKELVTISALLDGSLKLSLRGKNPGFRELKERPAMLANDPHPLRWTVRIPAVSHPWKQRFFNHSSDKGDISITVSLKTSPP